MNQDYMKTKPILPLVLSMSLPMVLSMLVNSLYNIVDSFFVARISENAMNALSLVFPIQNLITAIAVGFGVGMNAVIAFYLGTEDHKKAEDSMAQGLLLSAIHGLVLMVVCVLFIPTFLKFFTNDPVVLKDGILYGRIAFSFSFVIQVGIAFEKIYQSLGRMALTMKVMIMGCVTNIILDPILIFGLGPIPAMGIAGAAIATGIGQTVPFILYLYYYKVDLPLRIHKEALESTQYYKKLYGIGIPATLNIALPSVLISVLNAILVSYSAIYVVVLGIYYKLQTFVFMPSNGIIQGIRPLVGYNYGAKEYDRINKIYKLTLSLSLIIMIAGTLLCFVFPKEIMGLFTTNEETLNAGVTALRIISISFVFSSLSLTSGGVLEGLGMGIPSLIISLCRYVVIILPCAYILSSLLGPTGVWHAFWITEVFTAVISLLIYKKKKKDSFKL